MLLADDDDNQPANHLLVSWLALSFLVLSCLGRVELLYWIRYQENQWQDENDNGNVSSMMHGGFPRKPLNL